MYYLTQEQTNIIVSVINNAEITFSHLKDDLIDHLCCEIETGVRRGSSFEEEFERVKQKVGIRDLKKVQEDTLFLIDKRYRIMKKTMKRSGIISMTMLAFGAMFKILHFPGAGPLLVLGFAILAGLFFPTALWVMKKESKLKSSLLLYISGFIGGFFIMIGFLFKIMHWPGTPFLLLAGYPIMCFIFMPTLLIQLLKNTSDSLLKKAYIIGTISIIFCLMGQYFKIMHWPGASPMLILGSILLSVVFLPMYSHAKYKDSSFVQGSFIFLCMGVLFFTFFNNLLVLNVSTDILSQFVSPGVKTDETITWLNNSNSKAISNTNIEKNQQLKLIHDQVDEISNYIHDIKIEIVSLADRVDKKSAEAILHNPVNLLNKEGYDAPTYILIGVDEIAGKGGKANLLKQKINKLKSDIIQLTTSEKSAKKFIETLLNTPDAFNSHFNKTATWEMNTFYHNAAINTLNVLSNIELDIRLAESETIKAMQNSKEHAKVAQNKTTNSAIQ